MFGTGAFLMLGGTFILIGTAALLVGSNLAGAAALLLGLVELAFFAALYRTWRRPLGGGP
jgi:hypothetical protein